MVCARCSAVIADKAIVCYRCGAPTAVPAAPSRSAPAGRHPWGRAAASLAVGALAAWGAWHSVSGSWQQVVAIGFAAAALALAAFSLRPRRRG